MKVVVYPVCPFFCGLAGRLNVFHHGFSSDGVAEEVGQPSSQGPVRDLLGRFPAGFVARRAACVASCLRRALVGEGQTPIYAAVDGSRLQIYGCVDKALQKVGRSELDG